MLLTISVAARAQVQKVSLQAAGLTCSMCSNSINKSLQSVDFVDKVEANIKTSTFEISFKPNATVDFDLLKNKVEDAGFYVANFKVTIQFEEVAIKNDSHIEVANTTYHFLNVKNQNINGIKTIRILDKGFVLGKEYKKNSNLTKMECYKTGEEKGKRIFHVTI